MWRKDLIEKPKLLRVIEYFGTLVLSTASLSFLSNIRWAPLFCHIPPPPYNFLLCLRLAAPEAVNQGLKPLILEVNHLTAAIIPMFVPAMRAMLTSRSRTCMEGRVQTVQRYKSTPLQGQQDGSVGKGACSQV